MHDSASCSECDKSLKPNTRDAKLGMCRACWYLTEPAIASRYFLDNDYPAQSESQYYRLKESLSAFAASPTDKKSIRKCATGDRFLQYAVVTHELATASVFEALLKQSNLADDIRTIAAARLAGEPWEKWSGLKTGEAQDDQPDSIYLSPNSEEPCVDSRPVWDGNGAEWPVLANVPMTFVKQFEIAETPLRVSDNEPSKSVLVGQLFVFYGHKLVRSWSEYQQREISGLHPFFGLVWQDTGDTEVQSFLISQFFTDEDDATLTPSDLSFASRSQCCRPGIKATEVAAELQDACRRFKKNLNNCLKPVFAAECPAFLDKLFQEYVAAGMPRKVKAWITEAIEDQFRCVSEPPKWKQGRHWLYVGSVPMLFVDQFSLEGKSYYIFVGEAASEIEFKILPA